MEKHRKIALWLKGGCIVLAILGALFFGGLTWFIVKSDMWFQEDNHLILLYFSWYMAILCYGALFLFWKVCGEIGKDNSFSIENARNFHYMTILAIMAAVGYIGRIIYDFCVGMSSAVPVVYAIVMLCLSIVFAVICECLSQLIKNAYEIKRESELTI